MHQNISDLTPLPDLDVNPLQDFTFDNDFSPVTSPDSVPTKQGLDPKFTAMLPAFSSLFKKDDSVSLSSRSDDLIVSFNEESRSDSGMDSRRREPFGSCVTAPVWVPPVMFRPSGSWGTLPTSTPVSQEPPVWTSPLATSPPLTTLPSTSPTPSAASQGVKRRASSEARETATLKRRRDFSPVDPPDSSSPRVDVLDRSKRAHRERQRSQVIRDAFLTLRETIPLRDPKVSKIQVLRAATNYINFLHEVYNASAYELVNGEVPKGTKSGVKYALLGFKQKTIRGVFQGNSEVLRCAFTMWVTECSLEKDMDEKPKESCSDIIQSCSSSPTTSSSSTTSSQCPNQQNIPTSCHWNH